MSTHNQTTVRYNTIDTSRGYVTLLSLVIIGAISASLTVSLLLFGIQSEQVTAGELHSQQAQAYAEACAESALQAIRDSTNFSGSETNEFSSGSCEYSVDTAGGQIRIIEAQGDARAVTRKVRIRLDQITPSINITNWQSVADF